MAKPIIFIAVLAITLSAATSGAKEKPKKSSGKKEFAQGTRFFDAGEYDAALPLFRKAYELSGHRPSTVLALAQCERVLKLYDDAIAHYREYLAMDPPNAEKIRETVRLTQELIDTLGSKKKAAKDMAAVPAEEGGVTKPDDGMDEAMMGGEPVAPMTSAVEMDANSTAMMEEPGSSFFSSPWFWVITSVVVAGGAAAGYLYWPEPELYGGTRGVIATPGGD